MSDIAIRVDNLGKLYRIGAAEKHPQNLREALGGLIASPFAYLQRMMRPPSQEETLWALKDVSFEVQGGEVVGIIGRNGAGKTEKGEGRGEGGKGKMDSILQFPFSILHSPFSPSPRRVAPKFTAGWAPCWRWAPASTPPPSVPPPAGGRSGGRT